MSVVFWLNQVQLLLAQIVAKGMSSHAKELSVLAFFFFCLSSSIAV